MHMHKADHALRSMGIYSRGRFGSWKYEVRTPRNADAAPPPPAPARAPGPRFARPTRAPARRCRYRRRRRCRCAQVANQDHSCMLGVDAIDAILFGGNGEGVEATFNSPSKVNNKYRPYERKVDPAKELAAARPRPDGSARKHTRFSGTPVHLLPLPTWSAVTWHCRERDAWPAAFKALVPETRTKFFVHSYERCGVGDVKRPAAEMLFEGLHHLDRIPHGGARTNASALPHHVKAFYAKLPDRLLFVRPGSHEGHMPRSLRARLGAADFAFAAISAGAAAPQSGATPLTPALCSLYKVALGLGAAEQCPEKADTLADWQVLVASAERVRKVPAERWAAMEAAVDASASAAGAEEAERLLLGLLPQILGETLPLRADVLVAPDPAPAAASAAVPAASAAAPAAAAGGKGTAADAAAPAAGAPATGGKGTATEEADKVSP